MPNAVQRFLKRVGKSFQEVIPITTSAGATDGGKVIATDPTTGRLHPNLLPTGVAPVTKQALSSEALAAGNWVNMYNNAGVLNVRNADSSVQGKEANGFVLAAFGNGATVDVYETGTNNQLTGLTPGADYWLDPANPGKSVTPEPAYTAGQVSQYLGRATAANEILFADNAALFIIG